MKAYDVITSVVIVTKVIKCTFNYTTTSYWKLSRKRSLSQLNAGGVIYTPCTTKNKMAPGRKKGDVEKGKYDGRNQNDCGKGTERKRKGDRKY